MTCEPMLPVPGGEPTEADLTRRSWLYQPKLPGVRCLAWATADAVQLTNRRGIDITRRYPDIARSLRGLPDVLLDGELVACDEDGRISLTRIAARDRAARPADIAHMVRSIPAQYLTFDLLRFRGRDLRGWALAERNFELHVLEAPSQRPLSAVVPSFFDGTALWDAVRAMGMEGIVAKHESSTYQPGRHLTWVTYERSVASAPA
jgi:bifunctional non-homologous end joining protein LigD